MSLLELGRADFALWTDPIATRVHVPSLMAAVRTDEVEGVDIRFEGDEFPTPFDGEGRSVSWDMTARYARKQQPLRTALEHLIFDLARRQYDKRLLMRLHVDSAEGLSPELQAFVAAHNAAAVTVRRKTATPFGAAGVDLAFTATVVQHRFGTV